MSGTMTNDEIAEQLLNIFSDEDWFLDYGLENKYENLCSPSNIKSLLNERAALKAENARLREALERVK